MVAKSGEALSGGNPESIQPGENSIYLNSSYYTLCDGSNGACAGVNGLSGCSNSATDQAAWVNLNGYNTLVASGGCSCGTINASDLPDFACGDSVIVTDQCTQKSETVYITDSATVPCSCQDFCSAGTFMRAMDMTEGTFKYFENGSTAQGVIPILLEY